MVPLLRKGHEKSLFAFFVLQRDHGLLDVVIVRFELLLEIRRLIVQAGKSQTNAFQLPLALDPATVFGPDIDRDRVQEVLVMVVAAQTAGLLQTKDILQGGPFKLGIGHGGNIGEGIGFGVCAPLTIVGRELISDECIPSIFIFYRDGFDHDLHEICTRLNPNDVQNASLRLGEKCSELSIGVCRLLAKYSLFLHKAPRLTFDIMEFRIQRDANF